MQESDEGKTLITNVISTGKEGILTVPIGTIVLGKDGKPLSTISVEMTPEADVPAVPLGAVYTFGGYAVTCSPDGATFKPVVSLKFSLTADEWNALLAKANGNTGYLTIKFFDAASGGWVNVPTTVDPGAHSLTGSVSHFSNYGVFIDTTAMTPVVIETTPAVPEVPTTSAPGTGTPAVKMPVTAMTTDIGLIAWLLGVAKDNPIVTVAVTAIAGGVAYFGIWKRRIKF
jgi:hypothetical protein